jgi:hypothetical protein
LIWAQGHDHVDVLRGSLKQVAATMTGTNNEQYEATPGELLDALIDFSRKTTPRENCYRRTGPKEADFFVTKPVSVLIPKVKPRGQFIGRIVPQAACLWNVDNLR